MAIGGNIKVAGSGEGARNAGLRRRAVSVQLPVHKFVVQDAFRHTHEESDGTISRQSLAELMFELNGRQSVTASEMEFVMQLSDQDHDGHIERADVEVALAMWRGLQVEMEYIEKRFSHYDTNGSGQLEREQVRALLTDLNGGGMVPSDEELEWVMKIGKQQSIEALGDLGHASASDLHRHGVGLVRPKARALLFTKMAEKQVSQTAGARTEMIQDMSKEMHAVVRSVEDQKEIQHAKLHERVARRRSVTEHLSPGSAARIIQIASDEHTRVHEAVLARQEAERFKEEQSEVAATLKKEMASQTKALQVEQTAKRQRAHQSMHNRLASRRQRIASRGDRNGASAGGTRLAAAVSRSAIAAGSPSAGGIDEMVALFNNSAPFSPSAVSAPSKGEEIRTASPERWPKPPPQPPLPSMPGTSGPSPRRGAAGGRAPSQLDLGGRVRGGSAPALPVPPSDPRDPRMPAQRWRIPNEGRSPLSPALAMVMALEMNPSRHTQILEPATAVSAVEQRSTTDEEEEVESDEHREARLELEDEAERKAWLQREDAVRQRSATSFRHSLEQRKQLDQMELFRAQVREEEIAQRQAQKKREREERYGSAPRHLELGDNFTAEERRLVNKLSIEIPSSPVSPHGSSWHAKTDSGVTPLMATKAVSGWKSNIVGEFATALNYAAVPVDPTRCCCLDACAPSALTAGLNRAELRIAVTLWYHHVQDAPIQPKRGCAMLVPFVYTLVASAAAAFVVAATTIVFSEQKTIEWLQAVGMSQIWRNLIIDPLKAVAFGRSFELFFGMLLGGSCSLDEAALGVLQDEMEGQGEAAGEVAADGAAAVIEDVDVVRSALLLPWCLWFEQGSPNNPLGSCDALPSGRGRRSRYGWRHGHGRGYGHGWGNGWGHACRHESKSPRR